MELNGRTGEVSLTEQEQAALGIERSPIMATDLEPLWRTAVRAVDQRIKDLKPEAGSVPAILGIAVVPVPNQALIELHAQQLRAGQLKKMGRAVFTIATETIGPEG